MNDSNDRSPGNARGHRSDERLVRALEALRSAWETHERPPDLRAFLPDSLDERRSVLIELVKLDLDYRWLRFNFPKHLRDYLTDHVELRDGGISAELVWEEYHVRKAAGLQVTPDEYRLEWPGLAESLDRWFGPPDDVPRTTTSRASSARRVVFDAGDRIGDFELLCPLGSGSFATVFLARQVSLGRLVALKVSEHRDNEPQTLAKLEHAAIVRVFDQQIDTARQLRFLYMEYVRGGTLKEVIDLLKRTPTADWSGRIVVEALRDALDRRGESLATDSPLVRQIADMSWPEVVCWIGQHLADGLDHAHRQGILHRDVKPANILLSAEGMPKLADFNVSFCAPTEGETAEGNFGGSAAYMSPEQIEAFLPQCDRSPDSLDQRSDIYSLGLVLLELLAGRRPVSGRSGGNAADLLDQLLRDRRRGFQTDDLGKLYPPNVPPGLKRVIAGCLEPESSERWPSGRVLARELATCLDDRVERMRFPPSGSWRQAMRPWSLPVVLLLAVVPNGAAAVFNLLFNRQHIVEAIEGASATFFRIQTTINAIAFPLGMAAIAWMARSITSAVNGRSVGSPNDRVRLRRRALRLGHFAAVLGVAEWSVAGIAYPVAMHASVGHVPPRIYLWFLGSLVLCGLIAAAYPFMGITWFSLQVLYPPLAEEPIDERSEHDSLKALGVVARRYLVLAFLVPMLAVAALVLVEIRDRFALLMLSGGGSIGAVVVYAVFRALERDLEAWKRRLG